jgi:hypothetical protein
MPSTAEQLVQAFRVVLGVPKDATSIEKMESWLKQHCRDYRRHDDGDKVVVAMVLQKPMKGQKLRDLLAHHVRNWGFTRPSRARGQLEFMTIDSYMKEPVGALLQDKVKNLLTSVYQRLERNNDPARKARAQQLAGKLVKVLDKKLKPKLTSVFKRFWTNANKQIYRELEAKGENPAKSKKKLAFVPWWFRDAFDEDGKRTGKPILAFDGYEL